MDDNILPPFFYEIFDASLPRLGPGTDEATIRALDILFMARPELRNRPHTGNMRILDIGCGNGTPTIQLAKHIDGTILAVDNHQPFLDELQRRAEAEGVSGKIQVCLKDMRNLGPSNGLFDLVWSEGGVLSYMGFREGLVLCHSLLVPEGLMAITELTWFRPDPPVECRRFFDSIVPAMTDINTNLDIIKSCGFQVIGHFILPESAWWESFYQPLGKRAELLRKKYGSDPERAKLLDSVDREIDIYRKYSAYYGYAFFLMKRS